MSMKSNPLEKVDTLAKDSRHSRLGKYSIVLAPGEVMRRPKARGSATMWNRMFKEQGRTDYHAAIRTVEGVTYIYFWRDNG